MADSRAISRLLKSTGLDRSEDSRGRVSTFTSEGYKVATLPQGITVDYLSGFNSGRISDSSVMAFKARQNQALAKMYDAITGAGYWIAFDDFGRFIVTDAQEVEPLICEYCEEEH